jgi:hypothetical protein
MPLCANVARSGVDLFIATLADRFAAVLLRSKEGVESVDHGPDHGHLSVPKRKAVR